MSLAAEIERAAALLAAQGVGNPRLDAEVLLAEVLGVNRLGLYVDADREFRAAERACYGELIRRRARREPLQQIRGKQEFFSRDFEVDRRVLIPRPETELLVETALALARAIDRPKIVDVGSGSGAIAITLALEFREATIVATDVSPAAIDVGRRNARRLGAAVDFRPGDLAEPLCGERFDLVVSNPPYVPSGDIALLEPEVRDHEPRSALDGGADGLDVYRRLASAADRALATGGRVVVEIGFAQRERATAIFAAAGFRVAKIDRDLAGIERVLTIERRESERG